MGLYLIYSQIEVPSFVSFCTYLQKKIQETGGIKIENTKKIFKKQEI